jgi:hypothetical protein
MGSYLKITFGATYFIPWLRNALGYILGHFDHKLLRPPCFRPKFIVPSSFPVRGNLLPQFSVIRFPFSYAMIAVSSILETFFSRRGVKKVELGIKKAANLE